MYWKIVFLHIVSFFITVYSGIDIQPPVIKPLEMALVEGCYVLDINMVLPYNEPYSPDDGKSCKQYTCLENNSVTIFTCGAIELKSNCRVLPGDRSQAYPNCCRKVYCT